MFILNPNAGEPIYRQLMEQIRRMIASGQLKPGAALPSVREVAAEHAINPMTISKAYSLLESEGWLEHQRGKAMTVALKTVEAETEQYRLQRLLPLMDELVQAAQQLQLPADLVLQQLRQRLG